MATNSAGSPRLSISSFRRQLRRDCAFHGLEEALPPTLDLKKAFAWAVGESTRKAPGLERALALMGWEARGRAHRGIDDARSIVRLLPRILQGRDAPPL